MTFPHGLISQLWSQMALPSVSKKIVDNIVDFVDKSFGIIFLVCLYYVHDNKPKPLTRE